MTGHHGLQVVAHRGECHEGPPHAVQEAPAHGDCGPALSSWTSPVLWLCTVLLEAEDEAGEDQDRDGFDQDDQAELLPGLEQPQ